MKLSDLIQRHINSMGAKAKLLIEVELDDGTIFPVGQVSDILIDKGDDTWHFEANNSACTVTNQEIKQIK